MFVLPPNHLDRFVQEFLLTINCYVGQHCAVQLLENGYAVKGTVRSFSKENEVRKGIAKVIDAKDNLEFCGLHHNHNK